LLTKQIMKTTNNTILITGGGSGSGRGLAGAFHALGNHVIISGRTQKSLDEVTAVNPGMKALTVDVTDPESIQSFAAEVTKAFPKLNVLINNAGVMRNEALLADSEKHLADAEATITTNLLGPIRLTTALLPHLRKQPDATIVNVSSGLAFMPLAMTPTYSATKAAIHSYTQSLRYQLQETKIEVKELIPPYVATTLMGERQANDPRAMPLDEFIKEVMGIFQTQPDATEIRVERVRPLRFAAEGGEQKYSDLFKQLNDSMKAARPNG
jgi:uncharacterized oxidoreductase